MFHIKNSLLVGLMLGFGSISAQAADQYFMRTPAPAKLSLIHI